MKHACLIFLIALFIAGCGPPEFEKNIRILAEGIIVDENNIPIADAEIKIYTERATSVFGRDNFLLGNGLSNEKGIFSITSLFDRDEDFQIEIFKEPSFSRYYYIRNTKEFLPVNLTYNLGTVNLNRTAEFNYNITKTSPPNTELRFSFQFQTTECIEVFNNQGIDLVESRCLEETIINRSLTENSPEVSRSFITLFGSIVKFTYSINDGSEITQTLTIDNENYEFDFSY